MGPLDPDRRIRTVVPDLIRGRRLLLTAGLPTLPGRRSSMLTVALFDVFDTVIGRALANRNEVHILVAERISARGLCEMGSDEIVRIRLEAERAAQSRYDSCATLGEIHEELANAGGWPLEFAVETARDEIEVEARVSRALDQGRHLLSAARENGLRIIFVSDMHLPSPAIRAMLKRHECWRQGDTLWVSCEARVRKRDGELFSLLLDIEGLSPAATVHVGDHPISDRVVPRWFGIGATPVPVNPSG